MNLSQLKPPEGSRKKRKRVGRGDGSGHGGTACKGAKGQNARSGGKTKLAFEGGQMPMARRLPKRGFKNPFRRVLATLNLDQLKRFPAGSVIDKDLLVACGLIRKKNDGVKILGKGELTGPLTLKVDQVSQGAKAKIEAAGGSVVEVA